MMQKFTAVFLCLIALTLLCKRSTAEALFRFELSEIHPVSGRQGVCTQAGFYWISGSGTLAKYDEHWNLLLETTFSPRHPVNKIIFRFLMFCNPAFLLRFGCFLVVFVLFSPWVSPSSHPGQQEHRKGSRGK